MKTKRLAVCSYSVPGEDDIAIFYSSEEGFTKRCGIETGENPSYGIQRNGKLYVVSELPDSAKISCFSTEGDNLRQEAAISVPGTILCHLCDTGKFLVGSCWMSGNFIAVDYALQNILWDIRLAPGEDAHGHWVQKLGDTLVCCDVGMDILGFFENNIEPVERLRVQLPKGTAPRQIVPLPDGRFLVVGESSCSVLLCCYRENSFTLLDTLDLRSIATGYAGGACLVKNKRLCVPIRGTTQMPVIRIGERLQVECTATLQADWSRTTLFEGEYILAAQQRANFLEVLRVEKGTVSPATTIPISAPACMVPLQAE